MIKRDLMEFDIVIIGGGFAGLSSAIRIKQAAAEYNKEISVCILEKGAEIGSHIMSGAIIDPVSLNELMPDWQAKGAPLNTPVTDDSFIMLTENKAISLMTPPQMCNEGNYVISASNLCKWLGEQATELGVEIYAGFPAREILYDGDTVIGVITGDMGIAKDGTQKNSYQAGIELRAKYTILSEGCRGHLSEELIKKFNLRANAEPQTYALGIKEIWEIDAGKHKAGKVIHTIGWPLEDDTYGGSFIYYLENNLVSIGFVVGLDYRNPYLSPFHEMQKFKTHPMVRDILEGGKRVSYGAKALNEGGYQSIPQLVVNGAVLAGDGAGFLNVPRIKGIHNAMKSGMLAGEAAVDAIVAERQHDSLDEYSNNIKHSRIYKELYKVRNIRPAFRYGLMAGIAYAVLDTYLFRGNAPWTFKHHVDHESLSPANKCNQITYPHPDGKLTFDVLSSVFISNTNHEEDQPAHLQLRDNSIPLDVNRKIYASPETIYCPAGVYEIIEGDGEPELKINAQNCLHCKTCDIKDPTQNIHWVTPEGGGGPNYSNM